MYLPLAQAPSANGAGVLLVRAAGDPLALASAVRGAIHEQDPSLAVFGLEPLGATVSRSVSQRRFTMLLLGLFAGLALLLAAVGTYGVLSGGVAERRREIGIRLALGAPRSGMVRLVVGEGLALATVGLIVGVAGALALTRLLIEPALRRGAVGSGHLRGGRRRAARGDAGVDGRARVARLVRRSREGAQGRVKCKGNSGQRS